MSKDDHHSDDLREVNRKLKSLIASLRTERERHGAQRRPDPALTPTPTPAVSPRVEPAPAPARVDPELATIREELEKRRAEAERLRVELAEIEREHRRMCDDYVAVEEQNSRLAEMYVALRRVHGSLDRAEILGAIQEIVINMVGCEELAIFELMRSGPALQLAHAFGIDAGRWREVPLGSGAIGRAAVTGETYVAGSSGAIAPEDADLSACIPLKVGSRVTGAIAVFRLLGHKPGITAADHEIFELLSEHAGRALHCSALHARQAG